MAHMSVEHSRIVIVGLPVRNGNQIIAAMQTAKVRLSISRASQKSNAFLARRVLRLLQDKVVRPPKVAVEVRVVARDGREVGLVPPCVVTVQASPDGGQGRSVPRKLAGSPRVCLAW
jgi:hypothetical protein